jgi:outer membrane protein
VAGACVAISGCAKPLLSESQDVLRRQLIESHRAYLQATAAGPVIQMDRRPSEVEEELVREGRISELDEMSGPGAYVDLQIDLGSDLMGRDDTARVAMTLKQAIQLAVQNNLDLQVARMRPAIADTQLTQAQAAFDAVLYSNFEWTNLDTPNPGGVIPGLSSDRRENTWNLATGIRKPLTTGGVVFAQTGLRRIDEDPSVFAVRKFYRPDVTLGLEQPLLRNFGTDVNRSEINIARNAAAAERENLRDALLQTALNAETAYWTLVFTRQQLLVQLRLLDRTIADRDKLVSRRDFDAAPVQITEASSFVELRRSDVLRARQAVRTASDNLKRLIQSEDLPVAGEELIIPADRPADASLSYSLLDAVTTALQNRPELKVALLAIDDASIRQRVADNQRLPVLNLAFNTRFSGVGEDLGDAYDQLSDVNYIDYILGFEFEQPIGNRAAEAAFRQRQLERRSAVLDYQRQARDVVFEIKDTLRQLMTTYELIGATRAARRAAADNLRAIQAQEDVGVELNPSFINLKLQSQERLASAEIQEAQALVDYNIAVANFYRTTGMLLQRNNILISDQPSE